MSNQQWVKSGDVVFREGEPGDQMYIVTKGLVRIEKHSNVGPIVLMEARPGDFFGEMAMLEETNRTATATAVTETSLMVFERHDLNDLFDKQPEVAERIIVSLVRRLKHTTDQLAKAMEQIPRKDDKRRF